MKYNDHDILKYWDENYGVMKTRRESYVDPRNYILAILYYKFGYTENELSEIFRIDHSAINHAKKMPYNHLEIKNKKFIKHVEELIKIFPYNFLDPGSLNRDRLFPLTIMLDKDTSKSLVKFSKASGKRKNRICAEIIMKEMKTWDV